MNVTITKNPSSGKHQGHLSTALNMLREKKATLSLCTPYRMSVAERQNWHCKQELCVYAILAHLGVRIVSHSGKILKF